MWPHPVICFVTDRHRLAQRLGLDPNGEEIFAQLADVVAAAADAGIDLVQVRDNDLDAGRLVDCVGRLVERVQGSRSRIVVNDRFDIALAAAAHGVHLKDQTVSIGRIREAAPHRFLVGQSIHSPDGATESAVDYLIFGTVFPTRSKPELQTGAGLAGLEAAVRRARVPVLGIGGVQIGDFQAMAAAGAGGIAGLDLFLPSGPGEPAALHEIAAEARRVFDSAGSSSTVPHAPVA